MAGIEDWSKTAASNTQATPTGIDGTRDSPSDVDNWGRDKMGAIREWYEDAQWIDYGGTVTQTGATTYTIATDVTSFYEPGRRVKLFGTTLGTLYGTVVSSSYSSPNTTVTVTVDDGTALTANLSRSWYSILSATNPSLPLHVNNSKNILISGDFRTAPWQQRTSITAATTPANNDGTYVIDNWILISDGNDIVDLSQASDGSLEFDVQTISKQFGIVQFIENDKMQPIEDLGYVSLSIEAKSGDFTAIRAAVLAWDGTADSPTKDVVATWAGGGTDPTWASNYTAENTPSNLTLSNTYQTFRIPNIAIDTAGVNNLAVVIWLDDTTTSSNETLNIRRDKLQVSQSVSDFEYISPAQALFDAQHYYAKTFPQGTIPAPNAGTGGAIIAVAYATTAGLMTGQFVYPRVMLSTPAITTYNPSAAGNAWRGSSGDNVSVFTDVTSDRVYTVASGGGTVANSVYYLHITADARIGA